MASRRNAEREGHYNYLTYASQNGVREIEREGVYWNHLAQDRDQWGGSCKLSASIKGEEFLD
jgi:hypothetical protein